MAKKKTEVKKISDNIKEKQNICTAIPTKLYIFYEIIYLKVFFGLLFLPCFTIKKKTVYRILKTNYEEMIGIKRRS